MKRIWYCWLCWLLWSPGLLPAAFINGHGYVPVADWAQANGMKVAWLKRGAVVAVANHNLRAVFTLESSEAQINGVNVRLCFPTANYHGVPELSQLDAAKTLLPFLYPPRTGNGRKITTICLDPGHGGRDTGNQIGGHSEKTYTLALALELRDQLRAAGYQVLVTRADDEYVELPQRPQVANAHGADLFVSLHFNATATGREEAAGPETYCITPVGASSSNARGEGASYGHTRANQNELKSLVLACQVQKSLVRNLGAPDRGVRRARFAVLRDAAMPAILIEGGYMTQPQEGARIFTAGYRRLMARAIVQAIQNYQKILGPPTAPLIHPKPKTPAPHPWHKP